MATAARPLPEIIDLVSESDNEPPATPIAAARMTNRAATPEQVPSDASSQPDDDGFELFGDHFYDGFYDEGRVPGQFDNPAIPPNGILPDVPLVIDDFGYLNEDPDPDVQLGAVGNEERDDAEADNHATGGAQALGDSGELLTEDGCLARVYELFPDVCPDHVTSLYTEAKNSDSDLPMAVYLDRIIEKMLSAPSYPKRRKESQQLKRKREESVDEDHMLWERDDQDEGPRHLTATISAMLKAEFPTFTVASIGQAVREEKRLYKAYIHLATIMDTDGPPRHRGRPSMMLRSADVIADQSGWPPLVEELAAARRRAQAYRKQRAEEAKKKQLEDDNLQRSIAAGCTAECQACFDDLPMNRQIHCHGETPHFTCWSCMEAYIKSEIGESRCRVFCTAGCGAGFDPAQLNQLADKKLLAKLADLQQEKDIRDAALENLEECPFCDYKAIAPPIEEDFEFRCANPECEKVSCRRCKANTHVPISCEQHAKDNKINSRHKIEEAMTAALVRSCNRCKKEFIKEYGCNKMTCPSCQNVQCYVCSETLKGYEHFDQPPGVRARGGGAKCPLYDNLEQRHEREVKEAEDATRAEIVANNPDVRPEDLEIKMSDAVNKATEQRIRQAGPEGLGGGPMGWANAALGMGMGMGFWDDGDEDDPANDQDVGPGHERRRRIREQLHRLREQRLQLNAGLAADLPARRRRREAQMEAAIRARRIVPPPPPIGPDAGGAQHLPGPLRGQHIFGFDEFFNPPFANHVPNANAAAGAQQQHFNPVVLPGGGIHHPQQLAGAPLQHPHNQPQPAGPGAPHAGYFMPQPMMNQPLYRFGGVPNNQFQAHPQPEAPNENRRILEGVQANLRELNRMRRNHDVRQRIANAEARYAARHGGELDEFDVVAQGGPPGGYPWMR